MAFNIGSYGQQPQDISFGLPGDPMAQQGLLAAMRAMQPTMALMQPQQAKPPQPQQSGQTPLNQALFGSSSDPSSSGLIGNGGFSNTLGNWTNTGGDGFGGQSVPAQSQYGKPPVPDSGGEVAQPSPMMPPPPVMPAAAPPQASSGGGSGGMGAMLGGSGGGSGGGGDFLSLIMSLLA